MEILVGCAIEITESLEFVLHGVAVHEVHDDLHSSAVYIIDEGFEFVRRAEATGGGEEIGHVVSEGAVIGVLLYCHDLHAVIAQFGDTRQYIASELLVGIHFLLLGGHTDVALVDEEGFIGFWLLAFGFWLAVLPLVFGFVPYLCGEDLGLLVLHDSSHIRRDAFSIATLPFDEQFVELLMLDSVFRQLGFPYAVADGLESVGFVFLPSVHISFDIDSGGVGCPFAHDPLFVLAVMV